MCCFDLAKKIICRSSVDMRSGIGMWYLPNTTGQIIVPPIRKVGREILGETCDGLLSGTVIERFPVIERYVLQVRTCARSMYVQMYV